MAFDLPEALRQSREIRTINSQIDTWIHQIETGVVKADGTKLPLAAQTISDIKDQFDIVWPDLVAAQDAHAVALNKTP